MSEETEELEVGEEAESEATEAAEDGKPRRRWVRLAAMGLSAVLVLAAGAGGVYYFFLAAPPSAALATASGEAVKPAVFYELPDMTVNLADAGKKQQYLRLKVALEVTDRATIAQITPLLPRVLDTFQVYLRELRLTDLEGSAGIYRLKEEMRRRINLAVYPATVDDILFKELLIQ